jgi:hypothetical protein
METPMETLLLIPVDDSVVFPTMTVTLAVDVGDADRVVLVPRKDDAFASVGTIANVVEQVRLPGGGRAGRRSHPQPRARVPRRGRGAARAARR